MEGVHIGYRDQMPSEELERLEQVERRGIEVFGNCLDLNVWMSKFDARIGPGYIRDEIRTEAGCKAALDVLDELAAVVTPVAGTIPRRPLRRRR